MEIIKKGNMSTKKIAINATLLYVVMFVVIVAAFLLLDGGPWMKGMMHGSGSIAMTGWNWPLILFCLGVGFLLGFLVTRRK